MENQKYVVTIAKGRNPQSEAFNVSTDRFESMPEDLTDSDFHFDTEKQAHDKMSALEIVNYSIEEAFWLEN